MCDDCTRSKSMVAEWVADQHPSRPGYDINGSGTVLSAVDWRGNRFHVGDTVMYCIGAGRGQMMAIGEVVKIESTPSSRKYLRYCLQPGEEPDDYQFQRDPDTNRVTWVKDPDKGYKHEEMPYDRVAVQVLTHKTSGSWDNKKRTKPAWVNPMNITALDCPHDCGPCHSHEDEMEDATLSPVGTA